MKAVTLFLFLSFPLLVSGQSDSEVGGESWDISNGRFLPRNSAHDTVARAYWTYLTDVLPSDLLTRYVSSLRLFSDGPEEELGGMSPLNDRNSAWEIDIDTVDFSFRNREAGHVANYVHTVIHEFGHLLTLNPEQVALTDDEYQDDEKGYLTSEGYATPTSYLGKFVATFWPEDLLNEWDKIDKIRGEGRKLKKLYRFYEDYEDHFLTDYAAESPEEDIAESWTFFILSKKPTVNKEMDRKVLFFYDFPELVEYRKLIRENLN